MLCGRAALRYSKKVAIGGSEVYPNPGTVEIGLGDAYYSAWEILIRQMRSLKKQSLALLS